MTNWVIVLSNGETKYIQADMMGVLNDGSLLAFVIVQNMPQPMAVMGWNSGEWKTFAKSNMITN